MRQRWLTPAKLTTAGLVGLALIGYGVWVAHPPPSMSPLVSDIVPGPAAGDDVAPEIGTVDAIVLHAGGRGERFRHAMEVRDRLVADGQNPVMVFMVGHEWPPARDLCGQTEPFEVLCPGLDTYDTIGEARRLHQLATERGWRQVVAVTTSYHLRRVLYYDRRCTNLTVLGSAAPSPHNIVGLTPRVMKEMAALVVARVRRCTPAT